MKSILSTGLLMLLVVALNAQNTAPAVNEKQQTSVTPATTPGNFVDNNKNGICDNKEAKQATGHGKNFVDKNGDGICDNHQNCKAGQCNQNCSKEGKGNCAKQGKGNCAKQGKGYCGGNNAGCCGGKGQGNKHCQEMNKDKAASPAPTK